LSLVNGISAETAKLANELNIIENTTAMRDFTAFSE
jgi:hypothetical protein